MELIKYVEVWIDDNRGYTIPLSSLDTLAGELECMEFDMVMTLKPVKMTDEEFENLHEFTGW